MIQSTRNDQVPISQAPLQRLRRSFAARPVTVPTQRSDIYRNPFLSRAVASPHLTKTLKLYTFTIKKRDIAVDTCPSLPILKV